MSSLEWSDDEEQAVDVPAPSNFSIAYTMATDDCIPLKSSLMGQSSMMAQPVGPGPVEGGHQVEVEEEEEKTEATPQAPEEKAEFKTPQANGTGAAEASATHRPTEIDTTPKQATSPTSAYDMLENCDNDAEIARNLQQELDAESEAVDFQQQLQKALGRMDGSMTGWDFREELLNEEAPKCEVLEIEDEENEADAVNPLKARFCESVQRSNYKKRLQMKEEVAIGSENSEGDEPGKKKMKTHEKEVAEVKEVADEEIKQEVADEEIKQGVAEEQKKQEVAEEEIKKEVADEEIKQGVAEEEKKQEVAGEEIKQGVAEVAEEEKKKKVAEKEEKKNAAKKEKKKKIAEEKKKKEVAEEEKKKKVAEEKKKKEVAEEEKKKKVAEEKKKEEVAEEKKKGGEEENKEEVAEEAPKVKAMPKKRVQRTTPEDDGQDGTQRKKKKGPTKQDAKEGDRETKSKELNEANTKKSSEQAESKEHDEEGKEHDEEGKEHDEEQKGKNELLLDDPRYKKGTKMNDLSPQGQANLKEVRRLRAIQNSNAWHKKYPNGKGNKGVAGDTEAEGAKPDRAAEGEAEVAEVAEAASSSSKPAKTHTLKDAKVAWLT